MNFELFRDSNVTSQRHSDEINDGSPSVERQEKKKRLEVAFSEFTFTQEEDAEKAMKEYIDLTIPVTYKVKFSFTPETVMMRLSKDRLRRLNKIWEQSEDGLSLAEFMKLMIIEVPSIKEEKIEMIQGLIRLFKQVDVNGDGLMQWSEFVQYMIDQVQTESIVASQDVQGAVTSIGQKIRMQEAGKFQRLKRSGLPIDKGRHKRPMADAIICPDQKHKSKTVVMHSEVESTTIQWYSLDLKPICSMQVPVKSKADRVLSIAYQDLSKSLYSFGPQGTDAVYGVLCTDHILYFYIRNRGRFEHFYQIYTGEVMQTKVWFLPQHKAWLTAGKDFKIQQWNISPIAQQHEVGEPVQLHSDLITDCIEIESPFCIATCSLDRSIVLYDLKNGEAMRRFSRKHVTGVRHLRYLKDFGSLLISTGFEIFANVWGPQNLFGNAHLGKLQGHRSPITSIEVIQSRPFVYTLDITNELIIWDIRHLTPLQIIPQPNQNDHLSHGLLAINPGLLWIYGSRFITYDKEEVFIDDDTDIPDPRDLKVVVNAFHNLFFQTICVQTPQDLKIYSCLDGQLMVMHQSVFKHPHINCVQVRQDKRHRKAYIASSNGQIHVINIHSGVTLKSSFEIEDEKRALERDQNQMANKILSKTLPRRTTITAPVLKKNSPRLHKPPSQESLGDQTTGVQAFLTEAPREEAKSTSAILVEEEDIQHETDATQATGDPLAVHKRQIVDMILVWEDQMNQMIYADKKSYFVYDERGEKGSEQLRQVTGAHQSSITVIAFSYFLSLVATGTESGEVAVWDYELSQLLAICQGHSDSNGEITAIEFLQPYPVMVTAGQDSKICLWSVKPTPVEQCYVIIGMFYNISFNYEDDAKYPVRSLICHSGESLKGISRGQCMKHSQINAETYRDYKTNQVLATQEVLVRIDQDGNYRGLSQMKKIRLKHLKEALKTDQDGRTKVETQFEEMRLPYLPRMEGLDPQYDENIDKEQRRVYLFLGDDFGILKLWDLTYFLANSIVKPCKPVWQTRGDQYFPGRTETVNVSSYANRLRKAAEQAYKNNRDRIKDPEDFGLIIRECVAHEKAIEKLSPHSFDGLMSIGKDCQVRIWSHGLDLWGIIDSANYEQDLLWYFPQKDKKQREASDIIQMQLLAEQLRMSDEQAVMIERDSDGDNEEEQFTSSGNYAKFRTNFKEKRRIKQEAEKKEQNAIIEERREWNLALANSKPKKIHSTFRPKPYNVHQRAIERIEELFVAEEKLYDEIFYNEQSKIEIKGDVVTETAKKVDKLIFEALQKHNRDLDSSSPRRLKGSNKKDLFRNRISSLNTDRLGHGAKESSSQNTNETMTKSPSKKFIRQSQKSLSGSPLGSPTKRTVFAESPLKSPTKFSELQSASESQTKNITQQGIALVDSTPRNAKVPKVPAAIELIKNKELSKNSGFSSLHLDSTTSKTSKIKHEGNGKLTISIIQEVDEYLNGKVQPPKGAHPHVEKTLDQLNQTKTLMRRVEVSTQKQSIVEQYIEDKEYIQDANEDRKHLITCKNLPSIRDRLFSIKSKQQKALLDPKYNLIAALSQKQYGSQSHVPKILSQSSIQRQHRSKSRLSIEQTPFASNQPIKSHEMAMNELSIIAKDLEKYNKNRYFNDRAKSMMNPGEDNFSASKQKKIKGSNTSASLHPLSYPQNLISAQQVDMSQSSMAKVGLEDVISESQLTKKNPPPRGRSLLEMKNILNEVSQDNQERAYLRQYHSQLKLNNMKSSEKINIIRNLASIQTPNTRLKHENLNTEVSLERSSNLNSLPMINHSVLVPPLTPYGDKTVRAINTNTKARFGRQPINFELALGGAHHGTRNSALKIAQTDDVGAQRRIELGSSLTEEKEELTIRINDSNLDQLSTKFKQKVIGRNHNVTTETAAQSNSMMEHTLEKDPSRQYLEMNFNIGDYPSQVHKKNIHKNSQVFLRNISLSNVSGQVAALSEMTFPGQAASSLYGEEHAGNQGLKDNLTQQGAKTGKNGKGINWKAKRRQSEQTRINEASGFAEQVDLDELKNNKYLALKHKYTGKDSGMSQLRKREAENIQRQRERISELKDFKSVMRALKRNSTTEVKVAT